MLRWIDTKQVCRATIACNPATQPTQCITMTCKHGVLYHVEHFTWCSLQTWRSSREDHACKGCTASVARQNCVAKLPRVCPPLVINENFNFEFEHANDMTFNPLCCFCLFIFLDGDVWWIADITPITMRSDNSYLTH